MKLIFASEAIWVASITCIKLSILFVYLELFYVMLWTKRCAWSMVVFCVVMFLFNIAGLLIMCTPLARNYNPDVPGSCRVTRPSGVILSTVVNLVVDIILVVIPLSVVWRLKISYLKKIGVSFMFGLGCGWVIKYTSRLCLG